MPLWLSFWRDVIPENRRTPHLSPETSSMHTHDRRRIGQARVNPAAGAFFFSSASKIRRLPSRTRPPAGTTSLFLERVSRDTRVSAVHVSSHVMDSNISAGIFTCCLPYNGTNVCAIDPLIAEVHHLRLRGQRIPGSVHTHDYMHTCKS